MRIGVVIINFGCIDDTVECLQSIQKYYSYCQDLNVILVDNMENGDMANQLDGFLLRINYLKNGKNLGFARANNVGILKAVELGCEIIALINNDTVFIDNSLKRASNFLFKNHRFGIIGLKNYYYSDHKTIWQSGFKSYLSFGFTREVLQKGKNNNEIVEVDYVPGSSFIVRASLITEIGLLDERFFAYYEEYDFCIRAKKKNYLVGYLEQSKILHKVGKSSTSAIKMYLRTRNKLLFYSKHSNRFGWIVVFFVHMLVNSIRIVVYEKEKCRLFRAMSFGMRDHFRNKYFLGSINDV